MLKKMSYEYLYELDTMARKKYSHTSNRLPNWVERDYWELMDSTHSCLTGRFGIGILSRYPLHL